jgi:hypothetical protein
MLNVSAQLAAAIALTLLMYPAQAQKVLPNAATPSEIAMLPDFCQAKFGTNAELSQQWNQRMGPDKYVHLHHYCHGLRWTDRAKLTFDKQARRYYLTNAVNDFDYVIRNWPDGFYLKAEAKTRKSQAESMLRLL